VKTSTRARAGSLNNFARSSRFSALGTKTTP
jgi:hypothetical protein